MISLKTLTKSKLAAAVLISFFSNSGIKAADVSFDGVSGNAGFSARELKARSVENSGLNFPVVSTPAPSNELVNFWGDLNSDRISKLCVAAGVTLTRNAVITDVIGTEIGGGVKRYFRFYPDKRLGLVDEVRLKFGALIGSEGLPIAGYGSVNVGIKGEVDGTSMVIRPLEDDRYCKQPASLVKLYEVKTVLPIKAGRIAGMEKGEIWKLPMSVSYTISGGAGVPLNQVVTVSINGGTKKARKPMVSLYRIDGNNLRLRLRLDRVTVKAVGAKISTIEIPAGDIGLMSGENILAEVVDRPLAAEINKMIAFELSYSHIRTSGRKFMAEFYLNPNDAGQMDRLEEFLKGDFAGIKKLIRMGLRFDSFVEDENDRNGADEPAGTALGAGSSFAGSDSYDGYGDNLSISIPIIHSNGKTWASVSHSYQSQNDAGGAIHVQQRTRASTGKSLNIPFVGALIKRSSQRDLYVANRESADGKVTKPVMLYRKYEGFVRDGDSSAREMIDHANDVLKYAGVRGEGTIDDNLIPSSGIFPPETKDDPPSRWDKLRGGHKTYRAAMTAFKLAFAEKAVQDIIFAAPDLIMKAYMNVMREKNAAILDKVTDLFTINGENEVSYDEKAARKRLNVSAVARYVDWTNPLNTVRTLARGATDFIGKIRSVRNAAGWKERSERLAGAAAAGDMKYEDFMKVVVQLADIRDISSELYVHTDKRVKGEEDVTRTYSMFGGRDNNFNGAIADVARMRERFLDSSALTD